MRILFLANDFPSPWLPCRGTFNYELARSLAKRHEVCVVVPVPWVHELKRTVAKGLPQLRDRTEMRDGMMIFYPRYYYTPCMCRSLYHQFMWRSVQSTLKRRLREFRPDAVIGYWAHPDGTVAVKYARQVGAAAYVMVGGSDVLCQTGNSGRRQRLVSDTLRTADGVFVVSGHLRERVVNLGVAPERVRVAYRGVDQQRFRPGNKIDARQKLGIPTEGALFLSVGRMVPIKGLDLLIQAAARLQRQGLRFELALVGGGGERSRLKRLADDLGIGERVRFPGEVPHSRLADWYRAADWSVLTSHSEGVPNVLLESHACGTPFIATRVGGVPEIAREGMDLLADPADIESIARSMMQALERPAVDPQRLVERTQSLEVAAENLVAMMSASRDGQERNRTDESDPQQRTPASDRALAPYGSRSPLRPAHDVTETSHRLEARDLPDADGASLPVQVDCATSIEPPSMCAVPSVGDDSDPENTLGKF